MQKKSLLNVISLLVILILTLLVLVSCGGSSNEKSTEGDNSHMDSTVNNSSAGSSVFSVVKFSPKGNKVSVNEKITIEFDTEMDKNAHKYISITLNAAEGIPNNEKYSEIKGKWSIDRDNGRIFTFTPDKNIDQGSLVCTIITDKVKSKDGGKITGENRFFFITDDGNHFGYKEIQIKTMKKENDGKHNIPMHITIPKEGGPFPVMFWVHGGGWKGGTPEESELSKGNQAQYLAEHLGVASVGVSYRCLGSGGNFTLAMRDVMDAVQYIRDHAEEYNIDINRMGFYGGSAGTPLAALAAQRIPEAKCFVGYNGIYNFVENPGSSFGPGNNYGQQVPSAKANSAIYNLRENPPAVILLHGTNDPTINPMQSVLFAEAVEKEGSAAKVCLYEDEPHAFFNKGRLMELPTLYQVKEFLKIHLLQ